MTAVGAARAGVDAGAVAVLVADVRTTWLAEDELAAAGDAAAEPLAVEPAVGRLTTTELAVTDALPAELVATALAEACLAPCCCAEAADVWVTSPSDRETAAAGLAGTSAALLATGADDSSDAILAGDASVTIRAMPGAGGCGALMLGTGRASSVESGRDGALTAGRTLSGGTAAEADRAVARMTCSITAGRQRVSVNVRWIRADVPTPERATIQHVAGIAPSQPREWR